MGNKSSRQGRQGLSESSETNQRPGAGLMQGAGGNANSVHSTSLMPQHLANQYNNNPRQRGNQQSTQGRTSSTTTTTNNNASTNNNSANARNNISASGASNITSQNNTTTTTNNNASSQRNNNSNNNNNNTNNPANNNTNATTTTNNNNAAGTTGSNNNERGVQEGQMVKMLATIEASTVVYNASTQLLTFYITSICPSLTYEIHTGVKECVQNGTVFYMPNKPKMEPTRTAIEAPQDNRKITVKLDISRLEEKEKVFNKHYPKQMPCVIVLRYRTTELRKKEGSNEGEEMVVEHTEHTAVDLAEKPRRRVISQIVTATGNAYVVENLYGADNENATAGTEMMNEVMIGSTIVPHEGEEDEDGLCVICITNPKDTAVMPCRHMCMCKDCGEELLKHKPVCPVCRAPISTLLHMPSLSNNNNGNDMNKNNNADGIATPVEAW